MIEGTSKFTETTKNYEPQNTLFLILIGGNDFVGGRSVDAVISDVNQSLQQLSNSGAKNIVILKLPNVAYTPMIRSANPDPDKYKEKVSQYAAIISKYNTGLSSLKDTYPELNIKLFDAYALFDAVVQDPNKFALTNVQDSCLKNNVICINPSKYMFWDGVHPTTATNRILSDALTTFIKSNFKL